jgi:hypothetical protein
VKSLALIAITLAASAVPAAASTCREALATNSWTVGTMGQVAAVVSVASQMGLERDGAARALQFFCAAHPNTTLSAVIDLLRALNEYAKPREGSEIR